MTTARVALLLLTCMAAICHSKANQIPSISRLSLIRSELECADLSWSASVKPGEFESKNQWFLGKAGSFDQTSFKVSFAVYAVLVTVTAVGQFITVRYATADERDVQKRIRHIRYASTFIAFCLWFFYDFIFMCSRFVWLNSSPDADFEPWGFPDGKHDGDVLWVNRHFFSASNTQLKEAGCEFEHKDIHDYRTIKNATSGSRVQPLGERACQFVFVPFSAEILATCNTVAPDFEMDGERFSIGLGLFIYPVLMFISIGFSIMSEIETEGDARYSTWIKKMVFVWIFEILLGCQQAVVLLPLTSMTFTPFCAIMNVPSNRKYGACIHKWAAAGLPYGIPMMGFGGFVLWIMFKAQKRDLGDKEKLCATFTACVSGSCASVGALLFVIWCAGGLVIGMWFELGSFSIFADLGVFKVILAPSVPITIRLTEILSYILNKQEVGGGYGGATEGAPSVGEGLEKSRDHQAVFCVSSLGGCISSDKFIDCIFGKNRKEEQTDAEAATNAKAAASQAAGQIPRPPDMSAHIGFGGTAVNSSASNTGVRDKSNNPGDPAVKMTTSPPVPQYKGMPPMGMGGMPMGGMHMRGMPMPMGGMPMGMGGMGGMPMYR